jgi:hypothetical protein
MVDGDDGMDDEETVREELGVREGDLELTVKGSGDLAHDMNAV